MRGARSTSSRTLRVPTDLILGLHHPGDGFIGPRPTTCLRPPGRRAGSTANLLAFQPEERIAQVIQIRGYTDALYLVL